MAIKRTVLILIIFYFGQISTTDDGIRKGKFLGITGFLSGASHGLQIAPFWRQWNALFQLNVEKNRHHGIYVIPAAPFYYPHPPFGGYGLYSNQYYSPYSLSGIGGGGGGHLQPNLLRPSLFDDYKVATTTLTPLDADPNDKPKFDLHSDNALNSQWDGQPTVESNPNVSVFNFHVRDDRKTHKRDIEHKNQTDGEAIVATVVEITDMPSTTPASASEQTVQTASKAPEMQTTSTTEAATSVTTPIPTTTSTSTAPPSTTTTTTTPEAPSTESGFQPILNVYYGGVPNEYADLVYFTTSEPAEKLESPTDKPQTTSDRSDSGEFRPSVQYNYRNYRYDTDNHFVPIVGTKQIF